MGTLTCSHINHQMNCPWDMLLKWCFDTWMGCPTYILTLWYIGQQIHWSIDIFTHVCISVQIYWPIDTLIHTYIDLWIHCPHQCNSSIVYLPIHILTVDALDTFLYIIESDIWYNCISSTVNLYRFNIQC